MQAGGMELHERQVGGAGAGARGDGDAVAGGAGWRGGGGVDLAGAAAGDHHLVGGDLAAQAPVQVQQAHAAAAAAGRVQQQIDGAVALQHRDGGKPGHLLAQRRHDGAAGGVGRMRDTALAVAALAGQVQRLALGRERHALRLQPGDGRARLVEDGARGRRVAQAGAGIQRVAQVRGHAVARPQRRGNAALRVRAGAGMQRALADQRNLPVRRQFERGGHAGQTAADDDDVEMHDGTSQEKPMATRFRPGRPAGTARHRAPGRRWPAPHACAPGQSPACDRSALWRAGPAPGPARSR